MTIYLSYRSLSYCRLLRNVYIFYVMSLCDPLVPAQATLFFFSLHSYSSPSAFACWFFFSMYKPFFIAPKYNKNRTRIV